MKFPRYTIINLRYKNTWKIEEVRNITAYFNIWKGEFSLNLLLGGSILTVAKRMCDEETRWTFYIHQRYIEGG